MKHLIVVGILLCVTAVLCDHHHGECNALRKLKVKQQWTHAFGTGNDRIDFAIALWRAVFAQEPSYREYFKNVGGDDETSPEFTAHAQRVLGGLDILISLADTPDTARAALAHLHDQHEDRGIPKQAYDVFRNALMATVGSQLGRCIDKEAWQACYDVIAHGISGE